jgi:hypothetical protein
MLTNRRIKKMTGRKPMVEVSICTSMMLKGLSSKLHSNWVSLRDKSGAAIVKIMPKNQHLRAFQKKSTTVKLFYQAIPFGLFFSLFSPNICDALWQSCMDNWPIWKPSYNTIILDVLTNE